MGMVIGIDASRNRSGGAKAHLLGILRDGDPRAHGIETVHVWAYRSLADFLPDMPWLVKHTPPELEQSLLRQLWWQFRRLPQEARRLGCQILLNTDAGSICRFRPAVVMSRDMLSYEPGEIQRYGVSKARLRLIALRHVQNASLRFADGAIFLTRHAASVIQRHTGPLRNVRIIPHGVSDVFKAVTPRRNAPADASRPIEILYVSNAAMYKHQWHVVRATGLLRARGHNVTLRLVGGGTGPAKRRLDAEIARTDPGGAFVTALDFAPAANLPGELANADLFVFASSCENMPNTLVEAMASGLPIACARRGPMPEVLADGGVYFDPEIPETIADAVERLIRDGDLRQACATRARTLAEQYSWARCGRETWAFLQDTFKGHRTA
ncbi:MAG: glycosyltransferase family 4 protein [Alphaproteobacteria bacterium]|nr:glycosyltransferase family 4 protein [Alphaproteobacteria bacterium]